MAFAAYAHGERTRPNGQSTIIISRFHIIFPAGHSCEGYYTGNEISSALLKEDIPEPVRRIIPTTWR